MVGLNKKKMIRIERILIKNFKRFRLVDIKPDTEPGPLVFVGKNYLGKSNFLNAICWCLYEETPFKQSIAKETDRNEGLLNLDAEAENQWEEVSVEIQIAEGDQKYIFKRTYRKSQDSQFTIMRLDGNDWKVLPNPNFYLEMLLPKALRKYFIFAGENLERLYSPGFEKDLKEGIWNVSNVTVLDKSIEHLNSLITDIQREAGRNNPEIESLEKRKTESQEKQNLKKSRLKEVDKEIDGLKINRTKYAEEQKKYAKVKALVEQRESLQKNLELIKERDLQGKKRLNDLIIEKSAFLYIRKELRDIYNKLTQEEDAGKLPPDIQADFVKELQKKGVCICGRKISKSDGSHEVLDRLISEVEPAAQKTFMLRDKFEIGKILREQGKLGEEMSRFLSDRAASEVERDNIERTLKELSDQLKDSSIRDVSNIESALDDLEQKLERFNQEKGRLEHEILSFKTEIDKLDGDMMSAITAREKNKKIKQQLEFLENARDNTEFVRERITDRVRRVLSHKTEQYFKELFWDKDQFEKIEFTEDYRLLVFERGLDTPKNQISMGEGKVLALATLRAIAELSGFDTVPVFFDAPLSNLGTEIKRSLLDILPSLAPKKQLFIFSLDDSEMLEFIEHKMSKNRVYRLKKDPKNDHSTIIQPYHAN